MTAWGPPPQPVIVTLKWGTFDTKKVGVLPERQHLFASVLCFVGTITMENDVHKEISTFHLSSFSFFCYGCWGLETLRFLFFFLLFLRLKKGELSGGRVLFTCGGAKINKFCWSFNDLFFAIPSQRRGFFQVRTNNNF